MARIEALLAARLFLAPQILGEQLYFVSNLSGRLSLYRMRLGGSVPEPLLPPDIALQNPDLLGGYPYALFPQLGQLLLMLDNDGDENYQPMLLPLDGGFPTPAFGGALRDARVALEQVDEGAGVVYMAAESRSAPETVLYRGDLAAGTLTRLGASAYFPAVLAYAPDHTRAVFTESGTMGDVALLLADPAATVTPLFGTPISARTAADQPQLTGFGAGYLDEQGELLVTTTLFDDAGGLGVIKIAAPQQIDQVTIVGIRHSGMGELDKLEHLRSDRYLLGYNIDGCSWRYAARFDAAARTMQLEAVICGDGALSGGVAESVNYDRASDRFALAFSTATTPTQLWIVSADGQERVQQTNERVLGVPQSQLAIGEDASFTSHDGLRVSARLYLPAAELGYQGPRPLVYYVHGGPQSQERPDFAWFSMPLIQQLTLRGFAVFVPNARGSSGYGLTYMKRVDLDWGGKDRLDHVHAMGLLAQDARVDARRAAVVGRSYGGYMTLTLAARHPELWRAAVDMFGPYDLATFIDRLPPTWQPYFALAVGDPATEQGRALLAERSPSSYIDQLTCPLLVIQGRNDPRVVERESADVVARLRQRGATVEYLVFDDEGHDVLKFDNRVTCYNAIVGFFERHLQP